MNAIIIFFKKEERERYHPSHIPVQSRLTVGPCKALND
jgi:hypothetical protein